MKYPEEGRTVLVKVSPTLWTPARMEYFGPDLIWEFEHFKTRDYISKYPEWKEIS